MYANINSRWAAKGELTAATTTTGNTTTTDISVPGTLRATMTVVGVEVVDPSKVTGSGVPVFRAYIKQDGIVSVAVSAVGNSVTVAAGCEVRFIVEACDNGFIPDGL